MGGDDSSLSDVVEVPHNHERLAMIQVEQSQSVAAGAGEGQSRGSGGHTRGVHHVRHRGRSPCRSYEDDSPSGIGRVNLEAWKRGRSSDVQSSSRILSPAPMCSWGARFASRFRLCSLGLASATGHKSIDGSADQFGTTGSGLGISCRAEVRTLLPSAAPVEGIDVIPLPRSKVTVTEDFPELCPTEIFLTCASVELRCMLRKLTAECRWSGREVVDSGEGCVSAVFRVPDCLRSLKPCFELGVQDDMYTLVDVPWPVAVTLDETMRDLTSSHQAYSSMLKLFNDDQGGWLKDWEAGVIEDAHRIEDELRVLQRVEQECIDRLETSQGQCVSPFELRSVTLSDVSDEANSLEVLAGTKCGSQSSTSKDDPPPLQTRIVSQDQVRREPHLWCGPLSEEHESLTQRTEAVEDITEAQYSELVKDEQISVELIPGKVVYTHKSSGRRKARIVGCGNFCQSDADSHKEDLFASGVGSESIRMLVRRAALDPFWELVSVDVRTAFLQAPLMDMQHAGRQKVTVVKVPSILRELGITTGKYWRVKKALYGLASAPKSWSLHRDKVLAGLQIPCDGGVLRLVRMPEDANLWHIVKASSRSEEAAAWQEQRVGVIALYVDDILIGGRSCVTQAVVSALQEVWELSDPEKLSKPGDHLKFAGYELVRTDQGYRLHQASYSRDLLDQYCEEIPGTENTPAVKSYKIPEESGDVNLLAVTRKAQAIIGQVLWLSNRTRPDLAYGVNMAAQRIVASPLEALARAQHLVRYIRHAPEVGLHYRAPSGRCGQWEQLKFQETAMSIDAFSDASFAADDQCRSFGSVQLFWGGALIAWSAGRQTLVASHTAECELYALAEAHLLGKAMRPTVAALLGLKESDVDSRLYCDNAAAIQLCVLEAGSWRTRHLRLRGAVVRQDLESGLWKLTHLDGVFMPADIGTKPVGPSRLEDLLKVCDLWAPHLKNSSEPPRPQLASLHCRHTDVAKALLALIFLVQITGAAASSTSGAAEPTSQLISGFVSGFGIGCGWWFASWFAGVLGRVFRVPPVAVDLRPRAAKMAVAVQTEAIPAEGSLETGKCEDPFPIQSEDVQLEVDGIELGNLMNLYERLYAEQRADNHATSSSTQDAVPAFELRVFQGVVDRSGLPEVRDSSSEQVWLEAAQEHWAAEASVSVVAQGSRVQPPAELVATAKAPTVPPSSTTSS